MTLPRPVCPRGAQDGPHTHTPDALTNAPSVRARPGTPTAAELSNIAADWDSTCLTQYDGDAGKQPGRTAPEVAASAATSSASRAGPATLLVSAGTRVAVQSSSSNSAAQQLGSPDDGNDAPANNLADSRDAFLVVGDASSDGAGRTVAINGDGTMPSEVVDAAAGAEAPAGWFDEHGCLKGLQLHLGLRGGATGTEQDAAAGPPRIRTLLQLRAVHRCP